MENEKLIPLFGVFTEEDLSILKEFTKKTWGTEPQGMGSPMSNEIFANLPFREEITVPAMVIGTRYLDGHPDYTAIREARNCKVIIVLQEGTTKEQWYSPTNWADYFFDPSTKQITKAQVQLACYELI